MANLEKLYRLVSSLSKNEKRYFKQNAKVYSTDKEQEYIVLFDLISQYKTFDINVLKEAIKKQSIINISIKSKYLYDAILDSLNNYNKKKYPRSQLMTQLSQTTILQDRGLIKEAFDLIHKVKKVSKNAEAYDLLYLAIEKELEIIFIQNCGSFSKQYKEVCNERKEVGLIIRNIFLYKQALSEIACFEANKHKINFDLNDFLTKFPFLKQESLVLSFDALSLHYQIWSMIYHVEKDYQAMLDAAQKAIDIILPYPFQPNRILSLCQNYLVACHRIKSKEAFEYGLQIVENLHFPDKQHQAMACNFEYATKLSRWQLNPDYDPVIVQQLFDSFEKSHEDLGDYMHNFRQKLWLFDLVAFSIQTNNFEQFRIWLNRLIHLSDSYDFKFIEQLVLKFFKAMLYYEEREPSLMQREIRSIGYFINKHQLEHPTLMITKKLFQKLHKAINTDKEYLILEHYVKEIERADMKLKGSYWDLAFLKTWATGQKMFLNGAISIK